jgi:hypothetical protein
MRRFMMLVTVVLLMTAMLVASAAPAMAAKIRTFPGTPLPTVVCEEAPDGSGPVGWRDGTCWVFHPTATSFL